MKPIGRPSKYPLELRDRAVRMVFEHAHEHPSQLATIASVARRLDTSTEVLRRWVRQAERDTGQRPGLTTNQCERLKDLERENRELKGANDIVRKVSALFAQAELYRRSKLMVARVDAQRADYGVESICEHLPIAPSTYWRKVSHAMRTDFVLDALEQALHQRREAGTDAVFLGDLRDRLLVGLPQDRHHLLVGESGLFRGPS